MSNLQNPYESLRTKLLWPFFWLGFSVSALLSLIAFFAVSDLTERYVRRTLQIEFEDYADRLRRNPDALLATTKETKTVLLPSAELPDVVAPADGRPGYLQFEKAGVAYTVLLAHHAGKSVAIIHDDTGTRRFIVEFAWLLLAATVGVSLLAGWLGVRMSDKVVRPIRRLLDDLARQAGNPKLLDSTSDIFEAHAYPRNEIGRLVQAVESFAGRLRGFLQRERHFVGDVAHELRTPIAIMHSAAEVLAETPGMDEAARQRALLIATKADRLSGVVDAMLHLARENAGVKGPEAACAVADVLEEVVQDCRAAYRKEGLRILTDIRARPIATAERSMVYVILANLLKNACANTPQGNVVALLEADRMVVSDEGVGIPETRFPVIFQRFEKGEGSPGSGIGLSIVDRLVSALGWKIRVESRENVGTSVFIEFGESVRILSET